MPSTEYIVIYLLIGLVASVPAYRLQRRSLVGLCRRYEKAALKKAREFDWRSSSYWHECSHSSMSECVQRASRANILIKDDDKLHTRPDDLAFFTVLIWPAWIAVGILFGLWKLAVPCTRLVARIWNATFARISGIWTYESAKDLRTLNRNRMEAPK